MPRKTDYEFISTDPEEIVPGLVAGYELIVGTAVHPASKERLFIQWVASVIAYERVLTNYTGNQNIPSRAVGANLDALAEMFYEQTRPEKEHAVSTERFYISEPQSTAVIIAAGTRVTDASAALVWETVEDAIVRPGELSADVAIRCQEAGTVGNEYEPGQINTMVDLYDFCERCENITKSGGGADEPDDDEFYDLLRASQDAYSTAGPTGAYQYWAKKASGEIADVVANSPSPGLVYLYALMKDGKPAGEEVKNAVLEKCSASRVRAFTDDVHTGDAEIVPYNVDMTFYMQEDSARGAVEIQKEVKEQVEQFVQWQRAKMGRDLNPSRLERMVMSVEGVKRVEIRSPTFTRLRDGRLALGANFDDFAQTVPQVAEEREIAVLNGGYEDE